MPSSLSEHTEAVVFFSGDQVAREMLYPEFEAILDGFVPMPEYADQPAKAVYLTIDPQLRISSLVFFVVSFDARGMADSRWNLPLHSLIEQASRGPDLGGGPTRLVCFSQCPVEWHQNQLWDPAMDPGRNSFVLLRKAVARNRLGLVVEPPSEPVRTSGEPSDARALKKQLHEQYSQALRDRLARMIKEQRLRITTLNNRHERKLDALSREHQQRLQAYRDKVHELQERNGELTQRLETLNENFDAQVRKIEGMREYFSGKLEATRSDDRQELETLHENYELELSARVERATAEMEERLEMREMELFYRHQQENNLKEEVARLRRENQSLMGQGGGRLLERIDRAGVHFVAFHPGVGQLTIPAEDMAAYLDDPATFAARAQGLDPALYKRWLEHGERPECTAQIAEGQPCGKPVPKVLRPADFVPGESDRCQNHRTLAGERLAQ